MADKQAIRTDLEAMRAAYHELLASIPGDMWKRKSGNTEMTVKELMWHTAWSMSWMAGSIDAVRSGKSFNPPSFLVEPARKLAMHWLARRATPETAARKFDEGCDALIAKLDTVGDGDWQREATRLGETRSVEWYFTHPREHFDEHAADVRAVL